MSDDTERQVKLITIALNELLPGIACLDSACPTGLPVPHMASDSGNHPHPYGVISTKTHQWREKPWWAKRR
jgi:hypothetical protein